LAGLSYMYKQRDRGERMNHTFNESELILNPDGSIYHLGLHPEELADTVIFVGDPERVPKISRYFDKIEIKKANREFVTHTGWLGEKRITILATGIGCDNIDIVFNELDALVNIDLVRRELKPTKKSLNVIRLGTCGALQREIELDDVLITSLAFGISNLMAFYEHNPSPLELQSHDALYQHYPEFFKKVGLFCAEGDASLLKHFSKMGSTGHTVTCAGFYAPQGRELNGKLAFPDFLERIAECAPINNFEMETAMIYALGNLFGHRCCSISTVVNNRITQQFSTDIDVAIDKMVQDALEKIINLI
jgi:uridine phosphorylase